ncbi:mannose-6-phosphate isomerase [Oceanihabitans sp. 2_MG-2023]|uniref:type I phosphomannose isomerase catalytic subunit n=1 Tax=Oceanihabitans sp. 2_MG-2023 TaxID=3062661 RepID=UPI0026E27DC9|nr:type I phosphomannose isomerase catalytic subunit [Oceanihabitans sp. 2_MG-2023]MDO6597585.1 mannose-6-phosphate isomerase [Oceanihabitans sp. 2_MG-2023]
MLTYPIKFKPILKEKIWGGQKLKNLLNKVTNLSNIGESWEISDLEEVTSVVANGVLKGKTIKELLEVYKGDLLGNKNYIKFGAKFPLLIKFIDAKENLSVQLHPNDTLAAARHNSFGKSEMWYVLQADEDANLIVGFNQETTPEKYIKHLEDETILDILNFEKIKEGDSYFVEVGRIHAIGAGVMLAEIQQTSDITYRVYDWDREDAEGNQRELHNDLAIDAINFQLKDNFRVNYSKIENQENEMVDCPYFTTNYLEITATIKKENKVDSFIIYMCVSGEVEIETAHASEIIKKGETLLLPAAIKTYQISSKKGKLLEVYV